MQTAAESSWRQPSAPSGQFSWQKIIRRPTASAQGVAETLPNATLKPQLKVAERERGCLPFPWPPWSQRLLLNMERGDLVVQRTAALLAHVNQLRSQAAPLVPKNSKEKGLSKDSEHGPTSELSCWGRLSRDREGGTTPAFCKPALPFGTALESSCWDVHSTETSFDKLTSLSGKGLDSSSPPDLDISSFRHLVLGVTRTHGEP